MSCDLIDWVANSALQMRIRAGKAVTAILIFLFLSSIDGVASVLRAAAQIWQIGRAHV